MTFKAIFVDDDAESQLSNLFSRSGQLEISYREVCEAPVLANEIFNAGYSLAILDFRLDENPTMINPAYSYLGSGLAQLLRDKAIGDPMRDLPLVLMSAEEKFERFYKPDSTAHDLFDRTYGKEMAVQRRQEVVRQLIDLCSAYRQLKEVWNGNRFDVFALEEGGTNVLDSQELRMALSSAAAPHICANFILRSIIDRPGFLIADHDVAARLGVESISPILDLLEAEHLQYQGIFGIGWRRWWSHKISGFSEKIFGRRPITMGGDERAAILTAYFNRPVTPAKSTWNGSSSERFAVACSSCHKPTEIRHSLTAFDPTAPKFSVRRRICWDCVQSDRNLTNGIHVDDIDSRLAEDIKTRSRDLEE